jgi:hypothetical protein
MNTISTTLVRALCSALLLPLAANSLARDVLVIAHPSVALSADEVRDVFTGDKQFAGSTKLVPVDNAAIQDEFLGKVVKIDAKKYNSLWVKKSFRGGLAIPPVKGGDAEIAAFVKSTPGAVGYVSAPVDGVKSLGKF